MSAPLPLYQSRDAAVRQSFFDAAAAAAPAAAGSPSPAASPPPLPPPPPGHSGRQQQSTGRNSSGGRANNGNRASSSTPRDKGPSSNVGATVGGTVSKSSADEMHDTAALLQLHLQLSQHLQRGQQMLSDADIIQALKRLALKNTNTSGAPDPPPPPPCVGRTEQQQLRGKSSGSNYYSSSGGHHGQSYGRGSNDRSTLPSLRETNSGNNTSRGSVAGTSSASLSQGGPPPAPPVSGSSSRALHGRASLSGPNCSGTGYGTSLCSLDNTAQPPAPPGSQQSRNVQNGANGRTASRGKQHQHGPQSWRCRVCDAFNVGQPAGRCSCCGKLQPARHNSSNNGAGRRSHHGHKQLQQQGSMQQQSFQLQQLQRDVLLAAVSAAAAAAEKRADNNKVKRAAAAAAAAVIAAESQQHASGRKHGSPSPCCSYFSQNTGENLSASQNVGKEIFEGVSGLTAASGGAVTPESDTSFELFLTENFLRQQHHGHMGSGRLLTEDGYEDSTAAAAAAAAAAATLFPGLLQSLENCSTASPLLTNGLPSSTLHEGSNERAQQQLLARGGSNTTNGAASTSHTTPLGPSSELLEGFSSLDRGEIGRVANCLTGGSSTPGAPALVCNVDSNGSRGPAPAGSLSSTENGVTAGCSTAVVAATGAGPVQASPSSSGDMLVRAYDAPAADACLRGNSSRSRLVGACGPYPGTGDSLLSSAPGLSIGKNSTTLPGFAEECGTTPFSAATLLSEAEMPFDGNGSTTGMNIMAFQDFSSAPQSAFFGDVLTPEAGSFSLLGDCRSLSSGTPSSPLTRSDSNTMCSGAARVVRTTHQGRNRNSGACEMINGAHLEGGESSKMDRSRNQNAIGAADTLLANVTDDDGTATHRDAPMLNCGRGRVSRGERRHVDSYPSGELSHHNLSRVDSVLNGRSNHGSSSSSNSSHRLYPRSPGQQPQESKIAAPAAASGAAVAQPFHHDSLEQQLLQGAGGSADSPQCGDTSDFSVTRSSLPLSSAASSPSAGVGGIEEYSPLAVNGGDIGASVSANLGRLSGAVGLSVDTASLRALLPSFLSPIQMLLLEAKEVADRLVEEFTVLGYGDPIGKAAEALRTSLSILGYPPKPNSASPDDELTGSCGRAGGNGSANGDRSKAGTGTPPGTHNSSNNDGDCIAGCVGDETGRKSKNANWVQGVGGPHFSAPAMLAHPDEFKNPSSFLKIYGDPMCAVAEANSSSPQAGLFVLGARGTTRSGPGGVIGRYGEGSSGGSNLPIKGHNGNWVCDTCSNINFPRRFRCNKCGGIRGPQGDAIVAEYAKLVYHQHLKTYRNLASRPGVDLPLKRLQSSAGGGVAGNGGCLVGVGNGGTKKNCSSSYCSPSSNGGSTTTNSITGSTPSTSSETANMAAVQGTTVNRGGLHGTTSGTTNCHRIADGAHPPGSERGRAPNGSRMPTGTYSSGGAGNPVSHRNQNEKGQPTPETQAFPRSARSVTSGNAGSSVNCFPPPPSTQGTVAPAPPRYQPELACDDNASMRGIPHYLGSSPRANRGSTTKSNRVGHASLTGMFADSSPQSYKRAGNCSSRERQRGLGTACSTRSAAKMSQASFVSDSTAKPDSTVYSPNCSPPNCRPGGSSTEKDCSSLGASSKSVSPGMAGKAFNGKASPRYKQSPANDEVGKGDSAAPAPPAVAPLPTDACVSTANETAETMPTVACGKETEGSSSDGRTSPALDAAEDETFTSMTATETRSAVVPSEGTTENHTR